MFMQSFLIPARISKFMTLNVLAWIKLPADKNGATFPTSSMKISHLDLKLPGLLSQGN